jgi:predicted nucleotidyltransferase
MVNEEIYRTATPIGNSSHVILPKGWEGSRIVLTRIEVDPKKEILDLIYPYLKYIVGVYLFGSYARKENKEDSDIDVIIVTSQRIDLEAKKPFDIIQIEKNKFDNFRKINPILFYSFLSESEPIVNKSFLEELKKIELKKHYFKKYIDETKEAININRQLLDLNKSQKYADDNIIYSSILRLRGAYIIKSFFKKEKFSNNSFLNFLKNNLSHDLKRCYEIYQAVRDNKKTDVKVKIEDAKNLINLLDKMIQKI